MAKKKKKKLYACVLGQDSHKHRPNCLTFAQPGENAPSSKNTSFSARPPHSLLFFEETLWRVCITYGNTTMQTAEGV